MSEREDLGVDPEALGEQALRILAEASTAAAATAAAPPFEAEEELGWANGLAARTRFGKTFGTPIRPFTAQLKSEIKGAFEVDGTVFALAERAQRLVLWGYYALRWFTLALLIVYAAVAFSVICANALPKGESRDLLISWSPAILTSESGFWPSLNAMLVVGLALAAIRFLVRWVSFREFVVSGKRFSFVVSERYNSINARILFACNKVERRGDFGKWSDRAMKWTMIALWNAKRAEYLDRYSTTVTWKIQFMVERIEFWTVIAKVAAVAALAVGLVAVFSVEPPVSYAEPLVLFVTFAVTAVIGWFFVDRRGNDFWTEAFTQDVAKAEAETLHYFYQVGGTVHNLVEQIVALQRGGGAGGTGGNPGTAADH